MTEIEGRERGEMEKQSELVETVFVEQEKKEFIEITLHIIIAIRWGIIKSSLLTYGGINS